jgi:competence protein ComEC
VIHRIEQHGLVVLAGAWLAGVLGPVDLSAGVRATLGCAALASGLFAIAAGLVPSLFRSADRMTALVLVLATFASGLATRGPASPSPPIERGVYRLEGRVTTTSHGHLPRARIEVRAGTRLEGGESLPPGLVVDVSGARLVAGDDIRLLARLRPEATFHNPDLWTDRTMDRPAARGTVRRADQVEVRARDALGAMLDAMRHRVRERLDATLSPRSAGIARALVLGDRAADPDDTRTVREAGLAHILAVSGLHVALVVGFLVFLLRRILLLIPAVAERTEAARVAATVGLVLAPAYAAFAGGAPSAWRAAVTASIAWGLVALGRRPASLPVAAAAVLFLGALDDSRAQSPGFLLSVLATSAIVTMRPPTMTSLIEVLGQAVRLSARTTVATGPLVYVYFGSVPIAGLVANVVLVPVASGLLVPLALLHTVASLVAPFASTGTALLFEWASRAFLAACERFAAIAIGIDLPPPTIPQALAVGAACAAVLWLRTRRHRALVVAGALVAFAASEVDVTRRGAPEGVLRVTFLDVGQGDGAIVDLPDGSLMLIDAGGAVYSGPDPGARAVVPTLRARRRRKVDVAVVSHPHPDHYGGFEAVFERLAIRELWDSGQAIAEEPDGPAARLVEEARSRGATVRTPATLCGNPRTFGGAKVQVLWPCPRYDPGLDENDNSLVVRISYGRRRVLFTGDIEREAEAELAARGVDLRADVLKVAHHGSTTSSTASLLAAVRPRWAVLSAGRGNRYGHPHPGILRRLEDHAVDPIRLDREGGAIWWTDGSSMRLTTISGPVRVLD